MKIIITTEEYKDKKWLKEAVKRIAKKLKWNTEEIRVELVAIGPMGSRCIYTFDLFAKGEVFSLGIIEDVRKTDERWFYNLLKKNPLLPRGVEGLVKGRFSDKFSE